MTIILTPRARKALDAAIEQEYYRQGHGVQVSIMDIPKIYTDCRAAVGRGEALADAMRAAVDKYGVLS